MSLELLREAVKVNRMAGEDLTQTVVENDIIVPDVKPDIARILLLDAEVTAVRAEADQGKVLVNGLMSYKILYISDDPEQYVKGINTGSDFSYALDIPNASRGMRCKAKCDVLDIEYNLVNSRKINLKTIVSVSGKASDEAELEMVNGVSGLDDVQALRESVDVCCFVGENTAGCRVEESLQVPESKPAVGDILRNDIKITGKDFKVTDDRIIVKGDLNVSTLYIGDDETRSIQFMEHEIPFTQSIDIPGISESSLGDVDFQVFSSRFEPAEDSDGELRILNAEVELSISAAGFEKRRMEVLVDAYAPNTRLDLETDSVLTDELLLENRSQAVVKDVIVTAEDSPDMDGVFNVFSRASLSEYQVYDDKLVIEGVVRNSMLYTASEASQPLYCHEQELPFKQTVDLKGIKQGMGCEIGLDVEHCNYSMISVKEVEIRLVIGISVKLTGQAAIPAVIKAEVLPIDEKKLRALPTITIYYTQPGDNLWKIAKRYLTTVEALKKWNDVADDASLMPGQQVLIFKRQA